MASLRKFPRSPYWFGCFTLPDGRRSQRSTKETDRKKAQRKADEWEKLSKERSSARQFHKVAADVYRAAHGSDLPSSTVRSFFAGWLQRKEGEVSPATIQRYRDVSKRFLTWADQKADRLLPELSKVDIVAFRDAEAERVSASSANLHLRILRGIIEDARRDGHVFENPAMDVQPLKQQAGGTRRPFTVDEIAKVLAVANDEWRSMVILGLYTGQRIADIARLTWANVDFTAGEIHLRSAKTGRMIRIPICAPLERHLLALPVSDDPKGPLHVRAFDAVAKRSGQTLSREFGELLAVAGLVAANRKDHRSQGIGRSGKRAASELSFHSLRHSATSMMKNAGISPAVVQDIIGHDSAEVSRQYTKIESDAKRRALEAMPDITLGTSKA